MSQETDDELRDLNRWCDERFKADLFNRTEKEMLSQDSPPLPALWQRIEERLTGTLEAGLATIGERAVGSGSDPWGSLRVRLDLELAALDIARDEMRRDGMIPSMTAGRPIWFDTARAISRYLRDRIGMPLDPCEPGGGA